MADSQEKQNLQGTQAPQPMGIPSVAGVKKKPANVMFIVFAVLVLGAAIAFGYWQKHHKTEAEGPGKDSGRLFSGQVLTLPPIAKIEPPAPLVKPESVIEKSTEPEPILEPIVPLEKNPTLTPLVPAAPSEPPPPTLEEKRNMAKMMGEAATITDSLEDGAKKGLATSLQEEMGNSSSGGYNCR